jgi:hypothetical protein
MAAASVVGCSNGTKAASQASVEHGGTVGLALQVVPGITINTLNYSITGNGFSLSGSFDVSNSSAGTEFVIGNIPAGTGYTLTLTAVSADGATSCSGSTTFDVSAFTTTSVTPHLECRKGKSGGVGINPVMNVCPNVTSIATSASTAVVGASIGVTGTATDTDNGPSALSYTWTATSGTLTNASSASATFTCTAAGPATITLTASDGECSDTTSVAVTCTAPPPPPVTTNSILSGVSADCLSCAQLNGCMDPTCEKISGNAANGPAAGTSRTQLCLDTLTCVLSNKCAAGGEGTGG